ncbi:MAG: hypothetical protein M3354_04910 [Chloroflexota bacterium]|nr:hypothetical protein [Chloroflexota bacterium]
MDDERFDSLVRAIGVAATRRRIAQVMLSAALASVGSRLGLREAAAACRQIGRKCNRGDRCCGGAS